MYHSTPAKNGGLNSASIYIACFYKEVSVAKRHVTGDKGAKFMCLGMNEVTAHRRGSLVTIYSSQITHVLLNMFLRFSGFFRCSPDDLEFRFNKAVGLLIGLVTITFS